jgi:TolB-like protein/class 3 adenylate cyclase
MTTTRRLAAVLVADVVGYSRLMTVGEVETLEALKRRRRDILDPVVKAHAGRVVKVMGDGVLVEFASAVKAVEAALDLQDKFAAANEGVPEDRRIVLRIGINLGDVIGEGSDIYGDGVNIAARLESLAEPGCVCLSGQVYDAVRGKLNASFTDLGEQSLKNIESAGRAYSVEPATAVDIPPHVNARPGRDERVSIAVLPFDNMSGDPEQTYFSDGITEDIITELSKYRELLVIARNSSFQFRGKSVDVREIGRKLGVQFVVEGSVRRAGKQIRVTAQLIEVATSAHVWAEKYDRELQDVFAVQDEIVTRMTSVVPVELGRVRTARARNKPTESLTAQDHFLRGRHALRESYDVLFAVKQFKDALEADPAYAQAHALLAWSYAIGMYNIGLEIHEALDRATTHSRFALELSGGESSVLANVSVCEILVGEHELASLHSRQAIEQNPSDMNAVIARGLVTSYFGQFEEAKRCFDTVRQIDPLGHDQAHRESSTDYLILTGQYVKALDSYRSWPNLPVHLRLQEAGMNAILGRHDAAAAALRKFDESELPRPEPLEMIRLHIGMCVREEERKRLRDMYAAAGLYV